MKNHSDSLCGTAIDSGSLKFHSQKQALVYMDKVYSYRKGSSAPIIFQLNTGDEELGNFAIEISTYGGMPNHSCNGNQRNNIDLGCNHIIIDQPPTFYVEKSFAEVSYFNTNPAGNVSPMQASFDGIPAAGISYANGQYSISIADIDSQLQSARCFRQGLPTKNFFLLTNSGPWMLRATYFLEGVVSANGKTCCFKAKIFNAHNTPNTILPPTVTSNFAVENVSIPCATNGIVPNVFFQFGAEINLVNPSLIVNPCGTGISLISNVAVVPTIQIEVVKRSLFEVNAKEAIFNCDGFVEEAEDLISCGFNGRSNGNNGNNCCEDVAGETDFDDDCGCANRPMLETAVGFNNTTARGRGGCCQF